MYPRILICDDMIYSRAMLKNMIDQTGQYIIVESANREQLFGKIQENNKKKREFNFIFLDLEMRRDSGLDILEELRMSEPLLEVVLCGSGLSLSDENIARAMELGVKKFLPKPYKMKDVSMILKNE